MGRIIDTFIELLMSTLTDPPLVLGFVVDGLPINIV